MANLLKISLGIAKYLPTPLVSAFHAKVTKASSKYCGSLHCLYTLCQKGKIRKSAMGSGIHGQGKHLRGLVDALVSGTALYSFLPLNRLIVIKMLILYFNFNF
jgi:hypothetical protein